MKEKSLLFLLIILAIASFFRLWKLKEIPPGLYPDVAINGNEAFLSLKNRDFKVFYPENYGREGFFIWLISLSFSIFGVSIFSIRIVSATIGIFTVLGLYLLTKEIFNNLTMEKFSNGTIALLSSFFLAISFWHINFSRIGFRAILLPFILVFSFYFLFKGFKTKKLWNFIISGIFFGLGFYTYTSFRMAVLILPFIFVLFWFISKKEGYQKKFLIFTFLFLFFVFIVALPIGIYFFKNPDHFISRALPVTIFQAENPIKEFFKSLIFHLAMFNFYGDPNWRHNFSRRPTLFLPVGIFFLIGIFFSLKEIFRKSNYQNKNYQLLTTHYFLLSTFFIMLLPGILTLEGIPHSLRVIGVIPPVFIFAGLGALKSYQFFEKNTRRKKLLLFVCFFFLFALSIFEFNRYFFVWAKREEVKNEFTSQYLEMGNYLNSLPPKTEKYVIVNRAGVPVSWINQIPMPAQTIIFLEISKYGKIKSNYLLPENLEEIKIEKGGIVLPMVFDEKIFNYLKEKFPEGKIKKINNFFAYEIG